MKDEAVKEKSKGKTSEMASKPDVEKATKTEYKLSGRSHDSMSTSPKRSLDKLSGKSQEDLSSSPQGDGVTKKEPMLKKLNRGGPGKSAGMLLGSVIVVLLGIGSGWFLSGSSASEKMEAMPETQVIEEDNGKTVGIPLQDGEEEFDEAEGILESGGIDGEGTHHLVREGGESKYVYLTSTTLDLESFVGKTVLVKGETMAAQSAPWLMDVWVIKELE